MLRDDSAQSSLRLANASVVIICAERKAARGCIPVGVKSCIDRACISLTMSDLARTMFSRRGAGMDFESAPDAVEEQYTVDSNVMRRMSHLRR